MKTLTILMLAITICFSNGLKAQKKQKGQRVYKVKITTSDNKKVRGYLYAADNTGVYVSKSKRIDTLKLITVNVVNISKIELRRSGNVSRSALKGTLIGFGSGALLGLVAIEGDGYISKELGAGIIGATTAVLGGGIGALAGTKGQIFVINMNTKLYNLNLERIKSFTILSNTVLAHQNINPIEE